MDIEVKQLPHYKTAWEFLRSLHEVCRFQSREGKKVGLASTSELKRWLQNKAIRINGEMVEWNELMDFPIFSVILFPNNAITLL